MKKAAIILTSHAKRVRQNCRALHITRGGGASIHWCLGILRLAVFSGRLRWLLADRLDEANAFAFAAKFIDCGLVGSVFDFRHILDVVYGIDAVP